MRATRHLRRKAVGGTILTASLAVVLAASGSVASAASHGTHRAQEASGSGGAVNEGIVIAYTGPVSFEGGAADSGVYPAIHEVNAAGGADGHKVNIVTEDTRGDPADAVPIVDKLIATTSDLIGVVGPGTATAPTVVPILNSADVTDINMGGNASFDKSHYKYMWRLIPPDPANGEAMALWAKEKGYTKVAAVFGTTTGSQGDLPGVLHGIKAIKATVVAQVTLTPHQPSYRAEAEKVIAAHPQVVMTESDGTTAATFFSELKQLGGLTPIMGTTATVISTWLGPVRQAIGATAFKKNYTAVIDGTPKTTAATRAYTSALKEVKSKVPAPWTQWVTNPYSGADYDGVIAQALAMDAAHSVSPKVYNRDLKTVTEPGRGKQKVYTYAQGQKALKQGKKIQYVGATGSIRFDKYHNSFGDEAAVTVNGQDNPVVVKGITEKQIQALG
ncbi:MAG: ABC transporter substrate-binding protein [Acidimicrobiales bacterium]